MGFGGEIDFKAPDYVADERMTSNKTKRHGSYPFKDCKFLIRDPLPNSSQFDDDLQIKREKTYHIQHHLHRGSGTMKNQQWILLRFHFHAAYVSNHVVFPLNNTNNQ